MSIEGITKITPEDIHYATQLGYTVKLLAIGKESDLGVDVRVHPVLLPNKHPLASVNGVFNAIFVRGNPINEAMFYGPGAGYPTASAVIADIIEIARGIQLGSVGRFGCTCYDQKKICPLDETTSSYFVRLLVNDDIGVLGEIAKVFGDAQVSLKSVMQTNAEVGDGAELVIITHEVKHKNILTAEEELKKLSCVNKIFSVIRVEE